jgi:N-acetylneuraminic acid mutarotase
MGVLRWLEREMAFYCIELMVEPQEVAFAVGGCIGGTGTNKRVLASVERYDVANGAWREAAPMLTPRSEVGLCELNGKLYATGGVAVGGADVDLSLASVEHYDLSLDTWSAAPAMPSSRRAHCAFAVGDAMYVLGGVGKTEGEGEQAVRSVLKFSSRAQTWSKVAPMAAKRYNAGACVLGTTIYIFGGRNGANEATSTTYCFDTKTNTWTTLAPMPEAKCFHNVCVLGGLIYVMGGKVNNVDL